MTRPKEGGDSSRRRSSGKVGLERNRINFPLYAVSAISPNHVVVAGGGGQSNTGVFNGFAICELGYEKKDYIIYETQRHDTFPVAIMNCTVGSFSNGKKIFLAAGMDSDCYIYLLKMSSKKQVIIDGPNDIREGGDAETLRRRKNSSTANGDVKSAHRTDTTSKDSDEVEANYSNLEFTVQTIQSVQTDFSAKDPCQNCVGFSGDGRLVVTGGGDGCLRVWNFPEMKLKHKIEAAKREIMDLDVSPDRQLVSCVSRDGKCKIWSVVDGKLVLSLDLPPEDEGKFTYKRCKFGVVEDKKNVNRLFVILNPADYKKNKSYLQHWTGPSPFTLTKVKEVGSVLSALAVSKCGKYLAIGSMTTGDVDIYVSFSLQRIKHVEQAHKNFVTGLAFLPPADPNSEYVLADSDAAVVSVSIDNQIRVHHVERTSGISAWLAFVLVLAVLVCTFIGCSYIGL